MCGACGGMPADWAVPLVSGPRRRSGVAAVVRDLCPRLAVQAGLQWWTVRTATGATRVARSFDELLDLAAPAGSCASWEDVAAAVGRVSTGMAEEFGDYVPAAPGSVLNSATEVLTGGGDLYARLTGFGLAVRTFETRPVELTARGRPAPSRLLADDGRVLGAVRL